MAADAASANRDDLSGLPMASERSTGLAAKKKKSET